LHTFVDKYKKYVIQRNLSASVIFNGDETLLCASKSGALIPARIKGLQRDSPMVKHIRNSTAGSVFSIVNAAGDHFLMVYILKSKEGVTRSGKPKSRSVILPDIRNRRKGPTKATRSQNDAMFKYYALTDSGCMTTELWKFFLGSMNMSRLFMAQSSPFCSWTTSRSTRISTLRVCF
jgi:hypothetical protein